MDFIKEEMRMTISDAVFDGRRNGGGEQTEELPASRWLEPGAAVV